MSVILLSAQCMIQLGGNTACVSCYLLTLCGSCLLVSAAPLVDTSENHSGSAMLMLLSVVVVGLAVFVIYKFKR